MAKTDNLIHYLTDVANAIREKEESTDPINAQDFSQRIRDLQIGSEAGFLDYYYIDPLYESSIEGLSGTSIAEMFAAFYLQLDIVLRPLPILFKISDGGETFIISELPQASSGFDPSNTKIAIPKYIYSNNIVLGSGLYAEYSFPTYNDFIQLVKQTLEEMSDNEEAKLIGPAINEMLEHQITKEQFWNE